MEVGIREGEGLPGAERQLDRIKNRRLARVPRCNKAVEAFSRPPFQTGNPLEIPYFYLADRYHGPPPRSLTRFGRH